MKVLVTGATGFIGNHLLNYLTENHPGIEVVATSRNKEVAESKAWYHKVSFREFDLTQQEQETNCYEYFGKPDKLIHLAWEGLPNFLELYHFEENLPRHYRFLKEMIIGGLQDLTVTGTCFEYGKRQGPLCETMDSEPANAYALAKDTLRKFLFELQKKNQFTLKWPRLFYMYGSGQHQKSIIPQLEKALANGDTVFNMSGGEQLRDYLTVEQVGEYIVKISLQNEVTGIINCSSGKPISIKEFVLSYLSQNQKSIQLNLGYYPYPDFEPMYFWGENSKLKGII